MERKKNCSYHHRKSHEETVTDWRLNSQNLRSFPNAWESVNFSLHETSLEVVCNSMDNLCNLASRSQRTTKWQRVTKLKLLNTKLRKKKVFWISVNITRRRVWDTARRVVSAVSNVNSSQARHPRRGRGGQTSVPSSPSSSNKISMLCADLCAVSPLGGAVGIGVSFLKGEMGGSPFCCRLWGERRAAWERGRGLCRELIDVGDPLLLLKPDWGCIDIGVNLFRPVGDNRCKVSLEPVTEVSGVPTRDVHDALLLSVLLGVNDLLGDGGLRNLSSPCLGPEGEEIRTFCKSVSTQWSSE